MTPDTNVAALSGLIERVVVDPAARDQAQRELRRLHRSGALGLAEPMNGSMTVPPSDIWTNRARPTFLYVMYALLLWAIPMGVIAALSPTLAASIAKGMNDYLAGIPEPLYALFGTGYLGYTITRQWGKIKAAGG